MVVEVVDLDPLVVVGPGVEGREDGGRRAGLVLQRRREQGGRGAAGGEVDAVEVGQGAPDLGGTAAVRLEVQADLPVRVAVGERRRARVVAQERHVRRDGHQVGHQAADGDGDAAALAGAGHRGARGVGERVRWGRLDGAYGVGEDPPVVVVLRGVDAPGHEPGVGGRAADRVRGAAAPAPGAALAPGVHDEVGPARRRPQQMLHRQPAPAAVADELHDQRQRLVGRGGQSQPALHGVPAEPGERHVVRREGRKTRVDRLETGVQVMLAGLLQRLGPERVEVLGFRGLAAVLPEFVEGQIEQGHAEPPFVRRQGEAPYRMITRYVNDRRIDQR